MIKQYQKLALTTRDAGEFLGRRAETTWEHDEEELSEWNERKGDVLYQLVTFYEKEVIRLKPLFQELIETSDHPFTLNINWEDVRVLGLILYKLL